MKRFVSNQIDRLEYLLQSFEKEVNEFVSHNLNEIIREIVDETETAEEDDELYHISLNSDITIIMDGNAYTVYEIAYDENNDDVYLSAIESDELVCFTDIEPANQLEIISYIRQMFYQN